MFGLRPVVILKKIVSLAAEKDEEKMVFELTAN
jgi:hypothetical protein